MTLNPRTPLALGGMLLVFAVSACDCKGPKVVPVGQCKGVANLEDGKENACTANTDCGDHFSCTTPKGGSVACCIFSDRACNTEADCCPGQTCPSDRKKCFDKVVNCTTDADCPTTDLFCTAYSDHYGMSNRCEFKKCGSLGECQDGTSCFQGVCMSSLPCDGTCDNGKGCVPNINRCQDYSNPTGRPMAACPMTCMPGFIGTFKDDSNIWDSCNLPAVACVCAELPSLQSNDLGRFSSIAAVSGTGLFVSGYDGQYGDLVVHKFDATGKKTGIDYVDGVPNATPKYGPSGARGGVVDPGDDVGRYTDIVAAGNGVLFVSYYDVTHGDLRVAVRGTDSKWTTHKVDGDDSDTGLYTSIGLGSDGQPVVSYFQRGGSATFDASKCPGGAPSGPKEFITALKVAKATKTTPASASDWTVSIVACQSRPTPPCYSCTASDTCADPGNGPNCYTPAAAGACTTDAGSCDPNTDTCVTVNGTAQCAKKYNPSNLADIPEGVGLFSSLVVKDTDVYVAYMKRQTPSMATVPDGDLYAVKVTGGSAVGTPVLLDGSGDTGYFPDVKIDPSTGNVAVAYHDFTSKALKFYYGAGLSNSVTPEIIDPGTGMAGSGVSDWVGTDSALVFGSSNGQIFAVYQDATGGDLKLAKRNGTWTNASIDTMGAVGFFADALLLNGNLFASHAKIHAKLVAGAPTVDNSLIVEQVPQ
ncbi:MAG: hypothetical protein QM723_30000 [Myxococcaceae bacterium]